MKKIRILPLGKIQQNMIDSVAEELQLTYNILTEPTIPTNLPSDSYNPLRHQYLASKIIEFIFNKFDNDKILAITNEDLYAKDLNFVFGEAQLAGKVAVMSIKRLDPLFYKKPYDGNLFLQRTIKEAIHEVGHLLNLRHCSNTNCVMFFSNTIFDVDRKSKNLCDMCKIQLRI